MKYPKRKKFSHKGENGKILLLGGNELYHGAPILASLGAEASGCDLIFLGTSPMASLPARIASENFIVKEFKKDHFSSEDVSHFLDFAHEMCDAVVIGNGFGVHKETKKALVEFLSELKLTCVIDADALIPEILDIKPKNRWILTPHDKEFERIFGLEANPENIQKMANKYEFIILKTGVVDIISSNNKYAENTTGCPEMTIGGTGDALSGILGGLLARGVAPFNACRIAVLFWGKTGEMLSRKKGNFTAREMCGVFSKICYS